MQLDTGLGAQCNTQYCIKANSVVLNALVVTLQSWDKTAGTPSAHSSPSPFSMLKSSLAVVILKTPQC